MSSEDSALARLLAGFEQPIEDVYVVPANTTIEEQVARGHREIDQLANQVANPASLQFGHDLLDFIAAQAPKLGISGEQLGNLFGHMADLHLAVEYKIRENQPENVQ